MTSHSKSQPILTAINDGLQNTTAASDLATAANDMVNQMDGRDGTDFWHWKTGYVVQTDPFLYDSEEAYLKDALKEIYNSSLVVLDGDAIIIADSTGISLNGLEDFGYGFGGVAWSPPDSDDTIFGARVNHTPSQIGTADPVETFYNLAIHELAHTFSDQKAFFDHEDGKYWFDVGNLTSSFVSPLATAYTYTVDGESDTDWGGGSDVPDSFDCGPENHAGSEWCGDVKDPCRHDTTMSDCIKNEIDQATPL